MKRYRIAITGMSSQHCSYAYHQRAASFAGLLADTFRAAGHVAVVRQPFNDLRHETRDYDIILIGVSPLLSISSLTAYSALANIAQRAQHSAVGLFVDTPDVAKIVTNLRAVHKNPDQLKKPLFSARSRFSALSSDRAFADLVDRGVADLLHTQWPATLLAGLPWHTYASPAYAKLVLQVDARNATIVTPDHALVDAPRTVRWRGDERYWVTENTRAGKYRPAIVEWPTTALRRPRKWLKDTDVADSLAGASGVMLDATAPYTCWTPRYRQSFTTLTPVATCWRESGALGAEWAVLPSDIESMDDDARVDLSIEQSRAYIQRTPTSAELAEMIIQTIVK